MFTRLLCLTASDLKSPLTFTKHNRGILYGDHTYTPSLNFIRSNMVDFSVFTWFFKIFRVWSLFISDDPGHLSKTLGFMFPLWGTYTLSLNIIWLGMFNLACSQAKISKFPFLIKIEVRHAPISCSCSHHGEHTHQVQTRSEQAIWTCSLFLSFDPESPWNCTKNNRVPVLIVGNTHTEFGLIVFTRKNSKN